MKANQPFHIRHLVIKIVIKNVFVILLGPKSILIFFEGLCLRLTDKLSARGVIIQSLSSAPCEMGAHQEYLLLKLRRLTSLSNNELSKCHGQRLVFDMRNFIGSSIQHPKLNLGRVKVCVEHQIYHGVHDCAKSLS